MFTVKLLDGTTVKIGWKLMAQLVMWMDWQVRRAGYDPDSVTAEALRVTDGRPAA